MVERPGVVLSLVERGWCAARKRSFELQREGIGTLHLVKGRLSAEVRSMVEREPGIRLAGIPRQLFWPVAWALCVALAIQRRLRTVLVDNERSLRRVKRWPGCRSFVTLAEGSGLRAQGKSAAGLKRSDPEPRAPSPERGHGAPGAKLALIFNKTRPDATGGYFERAFRSLGLACDHWPLGELSRIPASYELYLRVDHGDDYEVPWPERLRPAVFYAIDTHVRHSWPKIRRAASRYDLVFCCHRDGAERLGAEWLPVACDPDLHAAAPRERDLDVAFVGTDGGVPRKFYLQALRERYPNSAIGTADYTQLALRYGRARIGFNYAIANDVNMRVFEVLASGALLVTNALPHDDLARLGLEEEAHYAAYRSPRELFARIDEALAHPEERCRIAEAGREAALSRHTYRRRMERLLSVVEARLGVRMLPTESIVRSPQSVAKTGSSNG